MRRGPFSRVCFILIEEHPPSSSLPHYRSRVIAGLDPIINGPQINPRMTRDTSNIYNPPSLCGWTRVGGWPQLYCEALVIQSFVHLLASPHQKGRDWYYQAVCASFAGIEHDVVRLSSDNHLPNVYLRN